MNLIKRNTKRITVILGAGILAAAVILWAFNDPIVDKALDLAIINELADKPSIREEGLRVVVVGSGGNKFISGRDQPCYLAIAGGKIFVFDAGLSAAKGISRLKLPQDKIEAVFITHFHSDHIAGLGALIHSGWLFGDKARSKPLDIYGPRGIKQVVEGFNQAFHIDAVMRQAVQGLPAEGGRGLPRELAMQGKKMVKVYDRDGLSIFAFPVDHKTPLAKKDYIMNAVGYRVEYKGRTAVFSGDLRYTPEMATYAKNADLLLHDAWDREVTDKVIALLREKLNRYRLADIINTASAHHASTIEAARVARQAQVKKLIMIHNHQPPGVLADWITMRGVEDEYKGEILIAEDDMEFYLPPKQGGKGEG
jgi:ribonuclease Z